MWFFQDIISAVAERIDEVRNVCVFTKQYSIILCVFIQTATCVMRCLLRMAHDLSGDKSLEASSSPTVRTKENTSVS